MYLVYDQLHGKVLAEFEAVDDAHVYGGALFSLLPSRTAIDQYLLTLDPIHGKMKIVEQAREFWSQCIPYVNEAILEKRSIKAHGGKWWLYMQMGES